MAAPHFGNWELLNQWLASRGQIAIVYKPPEDEASDAFLQLVRGGQNVQQVRAEGPAVRQLFKVLKDGGATGILPDQQPKAGDGVFVPFFGVQALTMTLVNRLAERTGATVLYGWCERIGPDMQFALHIEPTDPAVADPDPQVAATALNAASSASPAATRRSTSGPTSAIRCGRRAAARKTRTQLRNTPLTAACDHWPHHVEYDAVAPIETAMSASPVLPCLLLLPCSAIRPRSAVSARWPNCAPVARCCSTMATASAGGDRAGQRHGQQLRCLRQCRPRAALPVPDRHPRPRARRGGPQGARLPLAGVAFDALPSLGYLREPGPMPDGWTAGDAFDAGAVELARLGLLLPAMVAVRRTLMTAPSRVPPRWPCATWPKAQHMQPTTTNWWRVRRCRCATSA